MNMPLKDSQPVTDKELRKLRKGSEFCALCLSCGGCTKGHFHCTKCTCEKAEKGGASC